MSRLTAVLDWIDEAAGGLIRLAYLAAGVTAVAVYFGAGHLPSLLDNALNAGLPWALAFAVETHTYVTSRRVRATWQDRQASSRGSTERERANGALWVNLAVLAVLLAFSAWNQLGYLAGTWAPPAAGFLMLPPWLAYVVRALIVPAAFMAAAFLAPLAEPIAAQIENEARATLRDVFTIARKQRKRLLEEAERSGRDMTGALVELVPDPEARRIIAHAYGAIRGDPIMPVLAVPALPGPAPAHATEAPHVPEATMAVDTHSAIAAPLSARSDAHPTSDHPPLPEPELPPERPPTGPGGPAVQTRKVQTRRKARKPAVIRLQPVPAEERIRAALAEHPGASVKQLAEAAGVSSATASKWRKVIAAEQDRQAQLAQ